MSNVDYKTSTDYDRLESLIRSGKDIVCFVTYDFFHGHHEEPLMTTDVAIAHYRKGGEPVYDTLRVSARGIVYIDVYPNDEVLSKPTFKELCEYNQLQFIDIED